MAAAGAGAVGRPVRAGREDGADRPRGTAAASTMHDGGEVSVDGRRLGHLFGARRPDAHDHCGRATRRSRHSSWPYRATTASAPPSPRTCWTRRAEAGLGARRERVHRAGASAAQLRAGGGMRPQRRPRPASPPGKVAVNGWLSIASPYAAEAVGHSGVHSVTVDLQHGMLGFSDALAMLQAISATPATPMVRVAGPRPPRRSCTCWTRAPTG